MSKILLHHRYIALNFNHCSNSPLLLQPRFSYPLIKWPRFLDCKAFSSLGTSISESGNWLCFNKKRNRWFKPFSTKSCQFGRLLWLALRAGWWYNYGCNVLIHPQGHSLWDIPIYIISILTLSSSELLLPERHDSDIAQDMKVFWISELF